jgi:26S proteasome regulatory subunit N3
MLPKQPTTLLIYVFRALLAAQRTAALRRDDDTHAVLINLLLRNYLHYNLFSQADKFVSKTSFPQSAANPQLARNHFYLGDNPFVID